LLQIELHRQVFYYSSGNNEARDTQRQQLTLFTTCGKGQERVKICKNTIINWAKLSSEVNLILFDLNPELLVFAEAYGWKTQRPPVTSRGLPVVKHMFIRALEMYNTPYYGYANGDILFTNDLMISLQGISNYTFHGIKGLLIVGKRINYNVSLHSTQPLSHPYTFERVKQIAENSTLFQASAQDYFIVTKNAFAWKEIPDFVVGRVGYDNWLLTRAVLDDVIVIDATGTVTALHQTSSRGNFESHKYSKSKGKLKNEFLRNMNLAGRYFDYHLGQTICSSLKTRWDDQKVTALLEARQKWAPYCMIGFKKWKSLPVLMRLVALMTHNASQPVSSIIYDTDAISGLVDKEIKI
jgi:hypothetical protein